MGDTVAKLGNYCREGVSDCCDGRNFHWMGNMGPTWQACPAWDTNAWLMNGGDHEELKSLYSPHSNKVGCISHPGFKHIEGYDFDPKTKD